MQTVHHDSKSYRIEARVSSEDKDLFKRAAELSGMNKRSGAVSQEGKGCRASHFGQNHPCKCLSRAAYVVLCGRERSSI